MACVQDVVYTSWLGFSLFSIWKVAHKNSCSVNPTGTQAGRLHFIRGSANDSLYATRLPPPPLPVDVANESAPGSSACNPLMPVGALRESTFVSAACMPPPIPPSERNLPQPSSVVMDSPMGLELELETALSHPTPCDSRTAWIYRPQSISDVKTEACALELDIFDRMMQDRESDECALAILGPGKNPCHVGNDRKRVNINVFHDRAGHFSEPISRESARQRGITLTGRMDPCTTCIPARGTRADVPKRSEGRAGKTPGDLLHIDMCAPYTTTLGGNRYIFCAVDAATGYITNYALRRKSDAVAVFRRCIVDLAHKAGTRIRSVRGDCCSLWTSKDFRDFCSTMGIAVQHSPPGA